MITWTGKNPTSPIEMIAEWLYKWVKQRDLRQEYLAWTTKQEWYKVLLFK